MRSPMLRAALVATAALPMLAACTSNDAPSADRGSRTVRVSSTEKACSLSADSAPSGNLVFDVSNDGSQVTEFYLLAADGKRIIGEIENVGPGLRRQLVLSAKPGTYVTACKPGMKGAGIRGWFTVSGSGSVAGSHDGSTAAEARLLERGTASYRSYLGQETEALLAGTRKFVAAYTAGDYARARAIYPTARAHYEAIEPVAESFGDLDPKIDARQADLEAGQRWTGWHLLEKDLWWPSDEPRSKRLTNAERAADARLLLRDTAELRARVEKLSFTPDQIANGAKSLLDEVATSKVTGEEEIWSHTDLYDFQANIDGARRAFTDLRPALHAKDPALERAIAARFAALQRLLDGYRAHGGFVGYAAVSTAEVKALSDAVNALSEPMSRLTATILA